MDKSYKTKEEIREDYREEIEKINEEYNCEWRKLQLKNEEARAKAWIARTEAIKRLEIK